jgi:hypothetical protein
MKQTMRLSLLLGALLAVTSSANTGDWLQLELTAGNQAYDQVRILTQPRAGYSAATDHIKVFHAEHDLPSSTKTTKSSKKSSSATAGGAGGAGGTSTDDGDCVDEGSLLEGDDVPTEYWECCKTSSLKGFHVWPEQQDVTVGNSFYVDYKYTGGSSCGKVEEHASYPTRMSAGTYNSYMVQAYEPGGIQAYDRVIQFPK